MIIRAAAPEDADELLSIYAPYVLNTAITFEYEVPSVEEFRGRIAHTLERYPYLAAVEDGHIVGYAYAGAFKGRKAYEHSVEVSIYVRRDRRGRGIGRALYAKLEELLIRQNIVMAYACIAVPMEENDPYLTNGSERFHERLGYRTVGRFDACAYKFDRWYSMIWMGKALREIVPHPGPFLPFPGQLS